MRGRELHSEVLCGAVAPEAGGENGGRITLVDCALRLRPCEVDLGHGRHSVGRGRPAQALPLLSAMRPVLLANGFSQAAVRLLVSTAKTLGPFRYLRLLDFGKENIGHVDG